MRLLHCSQCVLVSCACVLLSITTNAFPIRKRLLNEATEELDGQTEQQRLANQLRIIRQQRHHRQRLERMKEALVSKNKALIFVSFTSFLPNYRRHDILKS